MPQSFGLVEFVRDKAPSSSIELIPLISVHVEAIIYDVTAQVVLVQKYKNVKTNPIETQYIFPLDSLATVCG